MSELYNDDVNRVPLFATFGVGALLFITGVVVFGRAVAGVVAAVAATVIAIRLPQSIASSSRVAAADSVQRSKMRARSEEGRDEAEGGAGRERSKD